MKRSVKFKICRCANLLMLAIYVLFFQGCNASKYLVSPGPLKIDEQPAVLFIAEHNQPNTDIGIKQIDEKLFSKNYITTQKKYKLTPGTHTITYYYLLRRRPATIISSEDFTISFLVKAGHSYTLKNYTRWDNDYPNKFNSIDFLTMITDTSEGEIILWDSSGTGAFKREVQRKTGMKFLDATERKAIKTTDFSKNKETIETVCGNDYCEQNESHSSCPADCFPKDIRPTDLSAGDKALFLDFVYKGQKSGIYFVVNRSVHKKLDSIPRWLSSKPGEIITKKDFILPKLNNQLQKEKLLPLVNKIKSLTPDIHKQARIAISLVQNIPYALPTAGDPESDYIGKYPYGVIWEQGGICSEKSDLLLFLLGELGLGTATFIFEKEDHRTVGIKCPDGYDIGDSGYCFIEVTNPKIITDNLSSYTGAEKLTDFTVIKISDGIQLEGVEEEFADKKLYYGLISKAEAKNGALERNEYNLYNSILKKYGM